MPTLFMLPRYKYLAFCQIAECDGPSALQRGVTGGTADPRQRGRGRRRHHNEIIIPAAIDLPWAADINGRR